MGLFKEQRQCRHGISIKPNGSLLGAVDGGNTDLRFATPVESRGDVGLNDDLRKLGGVNTTDYTIGHKRLGKDERVSADSVESFLIGEQELEDGEFMTGHDGFVPCDVVGRKRSRTTSGSENNRRKKWWA